MGTKVSRYNFLKILFSAFALMLFCCTCFIVSNWSKNNLVFADTEATEMLGGDCIEGNSNTQFSLEDVSANAISAQSNKVGYISSASQLAYFAKQVNEGDSEYKNATIYLTADIDLTGKVWTPIGTSSNYFSGVFDGQGHTIKGLQCDDTVVGSASDAYLGLFGYVCGTDKKPVEIKNFYLLETAISSNKNIVGGVSACAEYADIFNIGVTGLVKGKDYVGGIVGQTSNTKITLTYSKATVNGSSNVGGIVGSSSASTTISRCATTSTSLYGNENNITATDYFTADGNAEKTNTNYWVENTSTTIMHSNDGYAIKGLDNIYIETKKSFSTEYMLTLSSVNYTSGYYGNFDALYFHTDSSGEPANSFSFINLDYLSGDSCIEYTVPYVRRTKVSMLMIYLHDNKDSFGVSEISNFSPEIDSITISKLDDDGYSRYDTYKLTATKQEFFAYSIPSYFQGYLYIDTTSGELTESFTPHLKEASTSLSSGELNFSQEVESVKLSDSCDIQSANGDMVTEITTNTTYYCEKDTKLVLDLTGTKYINAVLDTDTPENLYQKGIITNPEIAIQSDLSIKLVNLARIDVYNQISDENGIYTINSEGILHGYAYLVTSDTENGKIIKFPSSPSDNTGFKFKGYVASNPVINGEFATLDTIKTGTDFKTNEKLYCLWERKAYTLIITQSPSDIFSNLIVKYTGNNIVSPSGNQYSIPYGYIVTVTGDKVAKYENYTVTVKSGNVKNPKFNNDDVSYEFLISGKTELEFNAELKKINITTLGYLINSTDSVDKFVNTGINIGSSEFIIDFNNYSITGFPSVSAKNGYILSDINGNTDSMNAYWAIKNGNDYILGDAIDFTNSITIPEKLQNEKELYVIYTYKANTTLANIGLKFGSDWLTKRNNIDIESFKITVNEVERGAGSGHNDSTKYMSTFDGLKTGDKISVDIKIRSGYRLKTVYFKNISLSKNLSISSDKLSVSVTNAEIFVTNDLEQSEISIEVEPLDLVVKDVQITTMFATVEKITKNGDIIESDKSFLEYDDNNILTFKNVVTYDTISFNSNRNQLTFIAGNRDAIYVITFAPNNGYYSPIVKYISTQGENILSEDIALDIGTTDCTEIEITYQAKTYNFELNNNPSNTKNTNFAIIYDQEIGKLASAPTKVGYIFAGYQINDIKIFDENGNFVANNLYATVDLENSSYTGFTTIANNNIQIITNGKWTGYDFENGKTVLTLNADWKANTYKITLNKQNGNGGQDAFWYVYQQQTYYTDQNCSSALQDGKITIPSRTGYTFMGYFTTQNGSGTKYIDSTGLIINDLCKNVAENMSVYAYWEANVYTITWNANGGSFSSTTETLITSTQTFGVATEYKYKTTSGGIANLPTRSGWEFIGFYASVQDNSQKYINADGSSAQIWNITENTTLFAHWKAKTYAITLYDDATENSQNGKTYYVSADTNDTYIYNSIEPNQENIVSLQVPTKAGFIFAGYYEKTNKTYGTQRIDSTMKYLGGITVATNIYIKWTVDESYDFFTNNSITNFEKEYNGANQKIDTINISKNSGISSVSLSYNCSYKDVNGKSVLFANIFSSDNGGIYTKYAGYYTITVNCTGTLDTEYCETKEISKTFEVYATITQKTIEIIQDGQTNSDVITKAFDGSNTIPTDISVFGTINTDNITVSIAKNYLDCRVGEYTVDSTYFSLNTTNTISDDNEKSILLASYKMNKVKFIIEKSVLTFDIKTDSYAFISAESNEKYLIKSTTDFSALNTVSNQFVDSVYKNLSAESKSISINIQTNRSYFGTYTFADEDNKLIYTDFEIKFGGVNYTDCFSVEILGSFQLLQGTKVAKIMFVEATDNDFDETDVAKLSQFNVEVEEKLKPTYSSTDYKGVQNYNSLTYTISNMSTTELELSLAISSNYWVKQVIVNGSENNGILANGVLKYNFSETDASIYVVYTKFTKVTLDYNLISGETINGETSDIVYFENGKIINNLPNLSRTAFDTPVWKTVSDTEYVNGMSYTGKVNVMTLIAKWEYQKVDIKTNGYSGVYDGNIHTLTATILNKNDYLSYKFNWYKKTESSNIFNDINNTTDTISVKEVVDSGEYKIEIYINGQLATLSEAILTVSITPANLEIKSQDNGFEKVYDGKSAVISQSAVSNGLNYLLSGLITGDENPLLVKIYDNTGINEVVAINSGKYVVKFTCLSSNYAISGTNIFDLTIAQRAITVSVDGEKVYDGNVFVYDLTNATVQITDGLLTEQPFVLGATIIGTLKTTSADVGTYSNVGTEILSTLQIKNGANDYTTNYSITYDISLRINQKGLDGTVSVKNTQVTYSAKPQAVQLLNVPNNSTVKITYTNINDPSDMSEEAPVYAGVYDTKITISNANYQEYTLRFDYTILQKDISLANSSSIYDGKNYIITQNGLLDSDLQKVEIKVEFANANSGTYSVLKATIQKTDNATISSNELNNIARSYNIITDNSQIEVKSKSITVKDMVFNGVYTGFAQKIELTKAICSDMLAGSTVVATFSDIKNAGTYSLNEYKFIQDNENYEITFTDTAKLQVNKLDVTVSASSGEFTKTYDGNQFDVVQSANINGAISGESAVTAFYYMATDVNLTTPIVAPTNAGSYFVKFVPSSNYSISGTTVFDIIIEKREIKVSVSATKEYDATILSVVLSNENFNNLVENHQISGKISTISANIGLYSEINTQIVSDFDITFNGNSVKDNYNISYEFKLEITKRSIWVSLTSEKTYDGTVFTCDLSKATITNLASGDKISGTLQTNDSIVKTYTSSDNEIVFKILINEKENINYNISYNVSLNITKRAIAISASGSRVYNAQMFTFAFDQNAIANGSLVEGSVLNGIVETNDSIKGTYSSQGENADQWTLKNISIFNNSVDTTENYSISFEILLTITPLSVPMFLKENYNSFFGNNIIISYNGENNSLKFSDFFDFDDKLSAINISYNGSELILSNLNAGTYYGEDLIKKFIANCEGDTIQDKLNNFLKARLSISHTTDSQKVISFDNFNFEISLDKTNLFTINKAQVAVSDADLNLTYNAHSQLPTFVIKKIYGLSDSNLIDVDGILYSDNYIVSEANGKTAINIGEYNYKINIKNSDNIEFENKTDNITGKFNINASDLKFSTTVEAKVSNNLQEFSNITQTFMGIKGEQTASADLTLIPGNEVGKKVFNGATYKVSSYKITIKSKDGNVMYYYTYDGTNLRITDQNGNSAPQNYNLSYEITANVSSVGDITNNDFTSGTKEYIYSSTDLVVGGDLTFDFNYDGIKYSIQYSNNSANGYSSNPDIITFSQITHPFGKLYNDNEAKYVGEYSFKALSIGGLDVSGNNIVFRFKINQKEISFAGNYDKIYDGNTIANLSANGLQDSDDIKMSFNYNTKDVGNHKIVLTITDSYNLLANYTYNNGNVKDAVLSGNITTKDATITLSNNASLVYGNALTLKNTDFVFDGLISSDSIILKDDINHDNLEAKEYTLQNILSILGYESAQEFVYNRFSGNVSNYSITIKETCTVTVTSATLTISTSQGKFSKIYDANPVSVDLTSSDFTETTYKIMGLKYQDESPVKVEYYLANGTTKLTTAPINAGRYIVKFISINSNYIISGIAEFELNINRRDILIEKQITVSSKANANDTREYVVTDTYFKKYNSNADSGLANGEAGELKLVLHNLTLSAEEINGKTVVISGDNLIAQQISSYELVIADIKDNSNYNYHFNLEISISSLQSIDDEKTKLNLDEFTYSASDIVSEDKIYIEFLYNEIEYIVYYTESSASGYSKVVRVEDNVVVSGIVSFTQLEYSKDGLNYVKTTSAKDVGLYRFNLKSIGDNSLLTEKEYNFEIKAKYLTILGEVNKEYNGNIYNATTFVDGIYESDKSGVTFLAIYKDSNDSETSSIDATTLNYTISGERSFNYILARTQDKANISQKSIVISLCSNYSIYYGNKLEITNQNIYDFIKFNDGSDFKDIDSIGNTFALKKSVDLGIINAKSYDISQLFKISASKFAEDYISITKSSQNIRTDNYKFSFVDNEYKVIVNKAVITSTISENLFTYDGNSHIAVISASAKENYGQILSDIDVKEMFDVTYHKLTSNVFDSIAISPVEAGIYGIKVKLKSEYTSNYVFEQNIDNSGSLISDVEDINSCLNISKRKVNIEKTDISIAKSSSLKTKEYVISYECFKNIKSEENSGLIDEHKNANTYVKLIINVEQGNITFTETNGTGDKIVDTIAINGVTNNANYEISYNFSVYVSEISDISDALINNGEAFIYDANDKIENNDIVLKFLYSADEKEYHVYYSNDLSNNYVSVKVVENNTEIPATLNISLSKLKYSSNYVNAQDTDFKEVTIIKAKDVGTYKFTATLDGNEYAYIFIIRPKQITVTGDLNKIYDGNSSNNTYTANDICENDIVSVKADYIDANGSAVVNIGEYQIELTLTGDDASNYVIDSTQSFVGKILKRDVKLKLSGLQQVEYRGQNADCDILSNSLEVVAETNYYDLLSGHTLSGKVVLTVGNVGDYDISYSINNLTVLDSIITNNYNFTFVGTLTVVPAKIDVVVSNTTKTYDGLAININIVAERVDGISEYENIKIANINTSYYINGQSIDYVPTNAGEYSAILTSNSSNFVLISGTEETITINKAPLIIKFTLSDEYKVDSDHEVALNSLNTETYLSGTNTNCLLYNNLQFTAIVKFNVKGLPVAQYKYSDGSLSVSGCEVYDNNYIVTIDGDSDYSIEKVVLKDITLEKSEFIYNGQNIFSELKVISIKTLKDQTITDFASDEVTNYICDSNGVEIASARNAGEYKLKVEFKNYKFEDDSNVKYVDVTINKRQIVNIHFTENKIYDGNNIVYFNGSNELGIVYANSGEEINVVSGDSVVITGEYSDTLVSQTAKDITFAITGSDAENYLLPTNYIGRITGKEIVVNIFANFTYNYQNKYIIKTDSITNINSLGLPEDQKISDNSQFTLTIQNVGTYSAQSLFTDDIKSGLQILDKDNKNVTLNYTIIFEGTVEIGKKKVQISFNSLAKSYEYNAKSVDTSETAFITNDAFTQNEIASTGLSITSYYIGTEKYFNGTENVDKEYNSSLSPKNVGKYTLFASINNNNYQLVDSLNTEVQNVQHEFNISVHTYTISDEQKDSISFTKAFLENDPELKHIIKSDLNEDIEIILQRVAGEKVGKYNLTLVSWNNANYDINCDELIEKFEITVNGNLQLNIIIENTDKNKLILQKVYNGLEIGDIDISKLTKIYKVSNILTGEVVISEQNYNSGEASGILYSEMVDAGEYDLQIKTITHNDYSLFSISFEGGSKVKFSILKREFNIVANFNKIYDKTVSFINSYDIIYQDNALTEVEKQAMNLNTSTVKLFYASQSVGANEILINFDGVNEDNFTKPELFGEISKRQIVVTPKSNVSTIYNASKTFEDLQIKIEFDLSYDSSYNLPDAISAEDFRDDLTGRLEINLQNNKQKFDIGSYDIENALISENIEIIFVSNIQYNIIPFKLTATPHTAGETFTKIYDGTKSFDSEIQLNTFAGDIVNIVAEYDTIDVGSNKTVIFTLGGEDSSNYYIENITNGEIKDLVVTLKFNYNPSDYKYDYWQLINAEVTEINLVYNNSAQDEHKNLPQPLHYENGYTFLGWYFDLDDENTKLENSTKINVTECNWQTTELSKTVYAKWTTNKFELTITVLTKIGGSYYEIPTINGGFYGGYIVKDFNGNKVDLYSITSTFDYKQNVDLTEIVEQNAGFNFKGYSKDDKNSSPQSFENIVIDNKNIALYAKFDPINVIITLKANGGTFEYKDGWGLYDNNSTAKKEVEYLSEMPELPNISRRGYTHIGWLNKQTEYAVPSVVDFYENTELTANWSANTYKLTISAGKGLLIDDIGSFEGQDTAGWTNTTENEIPCIYKYVKYDEEINFNVKPFIDGYTFRTYIYNGENFEFNDNGITFKYSEITDMLIDAVYEENVYKFTLRDRFAKDINWSVKDTDGNSLAQINGKNIFTKDAEKYLYTFEIKTSWSLSLVITSQDGYTLNNFDITGSTDKVTNLNCLIQDKHISFTRTKQNIEVVSVYNQNEYQITVRIETNNSNPDKVGYVKIGEHQTSGGILTITANTEDIINIFAYSNEGYCVDGWNFVDVKQTLITQSIEGYSDAYTISGFLNDIEITVKYNERINKIQINTSYYDEIELQGTFSYSDLDNLKNYNISCATDSYFEIVINACYGFEVDTTESLWQIETNSINKGKFEFTEKESGEYLLKVSEFTFDGVINLQFKLKKFNVTYKALMHDDTRIVSDTIVEYLDADLIEMVSLYDTMYDSNTSLAFDYHQNIETLFNGNEITGYTFSLVAYNNGTEYDNITNLKGFISNLDNKLTLEVLGDIEILYIYEINTYTVKYIMSNTDAGLLAVESNAQNAYYISYTANIKYNYTIYPVTAEPKANFMFNAWKCGNVVITNDVKISGLLVTQDVEYVAEFVGLSFNFQIDIIMSDFDVDFDTTFADITIDDDTLSVTATDSQDYLDGKITYIVSGTGSSFTYNVNAKTNYKFMSGYTYSLSAFTQNGNKITILNTNGDNNPDTVDGQCTVYIERVNHIVNLSLEESVGYFTVENTKGIVMTSGNGASVQATVKTGYNLVLYLYLEKGYLLNGANLETLGAEITSVNIEPVGYAIKYTISFNSVTSDIDELVSLNRAKYKISFVVDSDLMTEESYFISFKSSQFDTALSENVLSPNRTDKNKYELSGWSEYQYGGGRTYFIDENGRIYYTNNNQKVYEFIGSDYNDKFSTDNNCEYTLKLYPQWNLIARRISIVFVPVDLASEDIDYTKMFTNTQGLYNFDDGVYYAVGQPVYINAPTELNNMNYLGYSMIKNASRSELILSNFSIESMPDEDITVYLYYEFEIVVESLGNGTVSSNVDSAIIGESVTLTATANKGYEFDCWLDEDGNILSTNSTFTLVIDKYHVYRAKFIGKKVKVTLNEYKEGVSKAKLTLTNNLSTGFIDTLRVGDTIEITADCIYGYQLNLNVESFTGTFKGNIIIRTGIVNKYYYKITPEDADTGTISIIADIIASKVRIKVVLESGEGKFKINDNEIAFNSIYEYSFGNTININAVAGIRHTLTYIKFNNAEISNSLVLNEQNGIILTNVNTIYVKFGKLYWIDMHASLDGMGTQESPYLIVSEEDLATLAYFVNNNISSGDKTPYNIAYYKLVTSLDLNARYWTPIGTDENPFDGTFNLDINTISNIIVDTSLVNKDKIYQGEPKELYGLFGVVGSNFKILTRQIDNRKVVIIVISITASIIAIVIIIILLIVRKKKKFREMSKTKLYDYSQLNRRD